MWAFIVTHCVLFILILLFDHFLRDLCFYSGNGLFFRFFEKAPISDVVTININKQVFLWWRLLTKNNLLVWNVKLRVREGMCFVYWSGEGFICSYCESLCIKVLLIIFKGPLFYYGKWLFFVFRKSSQIGRCYDKYEQTNFLWWRLLTKNKLRVRDVKLRIRQTQRVNKKNKSIDCK